MKDNIFRTDTKALIGGVVMGIIFVIACQVAGAIDNLLPTGKAGMLLVNGSVWAFFTAFITIHYKQPAGLIGAEIEAIFAIWYSPLWVVFIIANGVGSIAVSFVTAKCDMTKWWHHILALFLVTTLGNICVGVGLYYIYELPLNVAVIETLVIIAVSWPASTILSKLSSDMVRKSGLII